MAVDVAALTAAVALAGELSWRTALVVVVALSLLAAGGLYRSRLSLSILDDAPAITGRLLVAAALTAAFRELAEPGAALSGARLRVVLLGIVLVLAGRAVAYAAVRMARRRRLVAHPTLVVGAGRVGHQLSVLLREHPEYGLDPIGFFDPNPLPLPDRPVPVLDVSGPLADGVTASGARVVLVAFGSTGEDQMVDLLRTCHRLDCEIFCIPRLFELQAAAGRDVDSIWGTPVIRLRRAAHRGLTWRLKRLFDVLAASLGVVALSPVLALCALATRLEGGPGVIFRQERVTLDGRRFTILKFRTLRPASSEESATNWNIRLDSRLRPVGRFLRATSLDELPQLWNVIRGDMSLVGPRPERPHFVGRFSDEIPAYAARHRVPCGLTGLAQIHGLRGDTSIEERARFDNAYVESWSLWGDMKILLQSVSSVVGRKGG